MRDAVHVGGLLHELHINPIALAWSAGGRSILMSELAEFLEYLVFWLKLLRANVCLIGLAHAPHRPQG